MRYITYWAIVLLALAGCAKKKDELGSKSNPIKIFFTPSVDANTITTNSKEFIKYLEDKTGLKFKTSIPNNYIAVVEAFGAERADVALINSFGYLMANSKYGATAKLTTIRFGETHYKGQIIAHVESGIESLADLEGKRLAFTDASSTSGYLFPLKLLRENNVKPGNTVFAMKHDNVVTMIYQRQVDAGATYYSPPDQDGNPRDARVRVKQQFDDVFEKIKIVALTEPIPNDPFVFRANLDTVIANKITNAIIEFLQTKEGQETLKSIYNIEGVVRCNDQSYDALRKMLEVNNIDADKLIEK